MFVHGVCVREARNLKNKIKMAGNEAAQPPCG